MFFLVKLQLFMTILLFFLAKLHLFFICRDDKQNLRFRAFVVSFKLNTPYSRELYLCSPPTATLSFLG